MFAIILFTIYLILEIAVFITSIRTKNNHILSALFIRIFYLLLTLILFFFNLISWSFRYYAIFIVLFLSVIVSLLRYGHSKKAISNYSIKSSSIRFTTHLLILSLCMLPLSLFPEYDELPTLGIYAFESKLVYLEDDTRQETFSNDDTFRQVGIQVWYPVNYSETFPLIIYSHGGISTPTSNESLFRELASQGYVVFSLNHPYHSIFSKTKGGKSMIIDSSYMKELNSEDATSDPKTSFELYQKWMNIRTQDINFVIDFVKNETQENPLSSLISMVDKENIAVIGHSLGGSAALCVGRQRDDIKAVIALESPYMCDILGVDEQGFVFEQNIYPIPVLNIYSDSTWDHLSSWPQYKQNHTFLSEISSDIENVHMSGAGHFSLTDLSLLSPLLTRTLDGFESSKDHKEILESINMICLEFLDKHLK